jgi:hypothetical protein
MTDELPPGKFSLLLQNMCLVHMSFAMLGVHDLSKRGIDGSRSSVEFAVVCIESIPAYAGVVVCGYYSWCMSGSLTGQLFSQFYRF